MSFLFNSHYKVFYSRSNLFKSDCFVRLTRSLQHSFIVILNYVNYKLTLQLSDLKSIDNFVKELKEILL